MRLLIIGNGIAAQSAAETYRKLNAEDEILMVSDEHHLTYQRIKLSHYLSKPEFEDDELLVKPASWYEEKKIEVKLNTKVIHIDFDQKQVKTLAGEMLSYDKLLLATGAHAFMPPIKGADKDGVFALRTIEDLKSILTYVKDRNHVVIIGGGLLGLEAAQGLVELGKKVTVLEFFPYLLPRQMDQEMSKVVQRQLEAEGIQFALERTCGEILGDQQVSGILFGSGETMAADAIIVSAGVRPNLALFNETALAMNKGVIVNERMQTNLQDVYAAGDVAEYNGVVFGLWIAANEHGRIAGSNMAGKEMVYAAPQMVTTLTIGEVKMFSAGDVSEPESTITWQSENSFHRLYVKQGHVVGAVLTGDMALMLKAKNMAVKHKEVPAFEGSEEELFMKLMEA